MHSTKSAKNLFTSISFFLFVNSVILAQEAEVPFTEHFGQKVYHPYLWLEDIESDTVQSWLDEQNNFKNQYFLKGDYNKMNSSLLMDESNYHRKTEKYEFQIDVEGYYPPRLMVSSRINGENLWPLVDCEDLKVSASDFPEIADFEIDEEMDLVVVAVSHSGSDWLELLVYSIFDRSLKYKLEGVRNTTLIMKDGGFYYQKADIHGEGVNAYGVNDRIVYHKFFNDPDDDHLVFSSQDKSSEKSFYFINPPKSDWAFVFHDFQQGSRWYEAITAVNLTENAYETQPFVLYNSPVKLTFDFVRIEDDAVYFRTDMISPTYQLLKFNLNTINDYEVVVDSYKEVLNESTYLNNGFYGLEYIDRGKYFGVVVDSVSETKLTIPLVPGTSLDFAKSSDKQKAYFITKGFVNPPRGYELDLKRMTYESMGGGYDFSGNNYEIEIVQIPSGEERVPATIIYHKNKFRKNGKNPLLIDVYGGYGIIQEPTYQIQMAHLISNGGVWVIPGVRGSGILGTSWAFAGKGINKQNTIDDIIATAEYLIKEKYTNKDLLFLEGTSHGGFAVTIAGVQRPDLFKGIISNVGVYDLIRINDQSGGYSDLNKIEFGDPKDSASFQSRLKLSSIHNLKPNTQYPAFLMISGANDSRIPIHQSYRFLAGLQDNSTNQLNFLHVTTGGHGMATYRYELLQLISLKFKFLYILSGYKLWH
ncbi:MAG: prolyl oligopeptidase family serine peptidase [Cyclobacteriaceae bacterium]